MARRRTAALITVQIYSISHVSSAAFAGETLRTIGSDQIGGERNRWTNLDVEAGKSGKWNCRAGGNGSRKWKLKMKIKNGKQEWKSETGWLVEWNGLHGLQIPVPFHPE
ncbi:hypothetical protein [Noviherbaspirillum suwonense]|jgi:hypothetical protein|uniref:hypothetical protein n=1 Tax=Noviherbaspirillum suwonense TaxID=1224511 RepID=UPI0024B68CA9|nr:hypothetical protein [Noviherbaspirillum suwonense]